jgi:hypothetical protein
MKKYKYLSVILTSVIGFLFSCNDDFLERGPLVNISDANYWKSLNDLKIYVNNFYNQDGLLPLYNGWASIGPYTDDADNGSDTYIYIDYNTRINGEATLPASGGEWSIDDWALLRDINYFMDHYNVVDAPWDNVKQYVGEALFFRSIFYFNKLRQFGDLPWASHTISTDSKILFEARSPRNQVVDSLMSDLDKAVEYLPERAGSSWNGRITKEVAMAFQARIALFEGTWEKYHALKNTPFKVEGSNGQKFIQKAADVSGALIALAAKNGYPALDNVGVENGYWKLFNQKDYSGSKEILFWRKYSIADNIYTRWIRYSGTGAGRGLTKSMIDSYLCTDGNPIAGNALYQGDKTLKNIVANRDPRLNQTIQVDDSSHLLWDSPEVMFETPSFEEATEGKSATGYQMYKGHTADFAEYNNSMGTSGCIYFRYAETLLIYAEAKAELGSISQADIDKTVNALRARVGMAKLNAGNITTDPNWEFAGLSPILQEVRRERKIELACEGFRMNDVFRWAAADELIVGKRPKGGYKEQWVNYPNATDAFLKAVANLQTDEKGYIDPYNRFSAMSNGYQFKVNRDYLYPIPTDELTLNPKLGQNPGW